MRSEEFRTRWAAHNVRLHRTGRKDIHHPVVGDLHLMFEALDLPADPGLSLVVYTADLASPSHDALNLLASWAATLDQADKTATVEAAHETGESRPGAGCQTRALTAEGLARLKKGNKHGVQTSRQLGPSGQPDRARLHELRRHITWIQRVVPGI